MTEFIFHWVYFPRSPRPGPGLGPSPGWGPVRVGAHMGPYGLIWPDFVKKELTFENHKIVNKNLKGEKLAKVEIKNVVLR